MAKAMLGLLVHLHAALLFVPEPAGGASLTISNSRDVVVDGLRSVSSELFHVVVLQSRGVTVRRVTVDAPADSPNTDGIHVHKSTDVAVYDAAIPTGDDCVSVGPGNSNLWIERVACGPGHGISIGSLGKQQGMAVEAVENVTVKTTWFTGTTNGLRIKTWGSSKRGYVRGVTFADATMSAVANPIIIDQHYCPDGGCAAGQSSGIKITGVEYAGVRGSSSTPVAVSFDCSRTNPCSGITLRDVKLTYRQKSLKLADAASSCRYAQGTASGLVVPPSCL
uniref:Polygalacturonase n=1 Tax=Oryza brachyantha TaxID=4533 RepID=J3L6M6_ORYBR